MTERKYRKPIIIVFEYDDEAWEVAEQMRCNGDYICMDDKFVIDYECNDYCDARSCTLKYYMATDNCSRRADAVNHVLELLDECSSYEILSE